MNLYSNALKFSKKNGYVKIICTYIPNDGIDDGSIQVDVIDSGIGIKKED